ncbi:MAG: glycosyltransferase family 4 protein [Deltaproteobacteria bacterium]|nr:glycosyltransferase family 4 protein [Deltaproteobacteria bacterium]
MLKRIFYLSYDLGSLSIHCHEIISNMIASGVNVEIFMPDKVDLNFHLHSDCTVHRIPTVITNSILADLCYQLILNIILIFRMAKKDRLDMVYARQNHLGILPILLARIYGIPYFAEMNGITRRPAYSPNEIKPRLKAFLERQCLKLANVIITPSNGLKQRIAERHAISRNKIYVVPNGVNEKLFRPRDDENGLRHSLGITDCDFLAGFVGSMGQWQGIEILKKAIRLNAEQFEHYNIKFLIVGDYIKDADLARMRAGFGEGQNDIMDFVEKNDLKSQVIYCGYVPYENSADYINICDVLVAPYIKAYLEYGGGSPMKLYSYLGCGKPVIISDLGEFTDAMMLRKYDAAFLVSPDDSQALATAILNLRKNKALRENLGKNGRNFVLKERKWLNSCLLVRSIYERHFDHSKPLPAKAG